MWTPDQDLHGQRRFKKNSAEDESRQPAVVGALRLVLYDFLGTVKAAPNKMQNKDRSTLDIGKS